MENLKKVLKRTDLITHTRCMGSIEEHYFNGFDGQWICGKATKETEMFGGSDTNDISVNNITHINRDSIYLVYSHPIRCGICIMNRHCKNNKKINNAYGGLECVSLRSI